MRGRRRPLPVVLVSRWLTRNGGLTGITERLWRGVQREYLGR